MAALWLRGRFLLKAREREDIQSPGHLKESRAERRESSLGMDIWGSLSGENGSKKWGDSKRDQYSGRASRKSLTAVERTKGFLEAYDLQHPGRGELGSQAQEASLDFEMLTCK